MSAFVVSLLQVLLDNIVLFEQLVVSFLSWFLLPKLTAN